MNEEELRAEVTRLENENKDLKGKIDSYETSIAEKDTTINNYLNDIKELKLKNYDLFIQIPKTTQSSQVEDNKPIEENTMSLNEITDIMKNDI